MKSLVITIAALCAMSAFAKSPKDMTPAERAEYRLRKTGGLIEKAGSLKGLVAIIDTQSLMTPTNIDLALSKVGDEIRKYSIRKFRAEPGAPEKLMKDVGATTALILVANDKDPSLLMSPDDHWAQINIKKCEEGLKSEAAKAKFFDTRCRKQFLRGFVAACSSISSSFPNNIMNVSRVPDLDHCEEFVPFDKMGAMDLYLKSLGFSQRHITSYRMAIREGWAPAPTNAYQKAVWDEMHTLPTDPIRIKPESKAK